MIFEYLSKEELIFLLRHCDRPYSKEELEWCDRETAENLTSVSHRAGGVLIEGEDYYRVSSELFNRDLLLGFLIEKLL